METYYHPNFDIDDHPSSCEKKHPCCPLEISEFRFNSSTIIDQIYNPRNVHLDIVQKYALKPRRVE